MFLLVLAQAASPAEVLMLSGLEQAGRKSSYQKWALPRGTATDPCYWLWQSRHSRYLWAFHTHVGGTATHPNLTQLELILWRGDDGWRWGGDRRRGFKADVAGEGVKQKREWNSLKYYTCKSREGEWQRKKGQKQRERHRRWGADFTLARPGAVVWYEPSSTGVRLSRAHLTGVTPCSSHCGAAQSLCAHNACELALTHLVIHGGKARPSAVICRGKETAHFLENLHSVSLFQYNTKKNNKVW